MDRPHATGDRLSADAARRSAAEHAQRAAHLSRRSAAARRRALLTVVLLVAVAGGWTSVGMIGTTLLLGAVPSVLLVAVLGLGRRAVLAGARADAGWAAGAEHRAPLPASATGTSRTASGRRTASVTDRAVHPSDATTEVMARVPAVSAERAGTEAAGAGRGTPRVGASVPQPDEVTTGTTGPQTDADAEATTWAPVPVPRPTYTLKPAARRAEPAPLDLDDDWSPAGVTAAAARADEARTADDGRPDGRGVAPGTRGLNLDAILARRRAAGE